MMVSIIIPYYNQRREFFQALRSIRAQSYRPLEVIVVDDGSEENIEQFRPQITGILGDIPVITHRQQNKGAPSARNQGFKLATGEYIIFWDADIIGAPGMVERLFRELQRYPEASYAYSNFELVVFGLRKKMSARQFDDVALKENNYIHSTSLIRKDAVIPWDESLGRFQDWDYWLTLAEKSKTGVWVDRNLFCVQAGGIMSHWLPRLAYRKPWKWLPGVRSHVAHYEEKRAIVLQKHHIVS